MSEENLTAVFGGTFDPVHIGHIGLAVGRGALISIILVLTVLPQIIVLCDKLIEKTTFRIGGKEE